MKKIINKNQEKKTKEVAKSLKNFMTTMDNLLQSQQKALSGNKRELKLKHVIHDMSKNLFII